MSVPEDVLAHRHWLLSFVELREPAACIDLGCGNGADWIDLAQRSPHPRNRFVGIDASEKEITDAISTAADPRLEFRLGNLGSRLPFNDQEFDVVYSSNLLECIETPLFFAQEVGRILKPGGLVVVGHWDWDSQIYESTDKALVRRLVNAFADWKQPWMNHVDGWMGRRLWGIFNQSGLFDGTPHARVLTNTIYSEPFYGRARADDFRHLVRHNFVSAGDVARFMSEQDELVDCNN
jgi:SAM-dependent methyltransferase